MFRRRKAGAADAELPPAFAIALRNVDDAREALLGAVPTRRGPGMPLAESLATFEQGLAFARDVLSERLPGAPDEQRRACLAAIDESLRRAVRLRLEQSPDGYQELYVLLGDILDPLEMFGEVLEQ
jgi:hypothetical protein